MVTKFFKKKEKIEELDLSIDTSVNITVFHSDILNTSKFKNVEVPTLF